MVRNFNDLNPEEEDKLRKAWEQIVLGLRVIEQMTETELEDFVYAILVDEIQHQKLDEVK
jgi:hypothetical protein